MDTDRLLVTLMLPLGEVDCESEPEVEVEGLTLSDGLKVVGGVGVPPRGVAVEEREGEMVEVRERLFVEVEQRVEEAHFVGVRLGDTEVEGERVMDELGAEDRDTLGDVLSLGEGLPLKDGVNEGLEDREGDWD